MHVYVWFSNPLPRLVLAGVAGVLYVLVPSRECHFASHSQPAPGAGMGDKSVYFKTVF